jgi:hypothetical protein
VLKAVCALYENSQVLAFSDLLKPMLFDKHPQQQKGAPQNAQLPDLLSHVGFEPTTNGLIDVASLGKNIMLT